MTSMMNEGGRIHEEHKEQLTTVNILNKVEGCLERVKRFVIKLPSANDLTKILTSLEVIRINSQLILLIYIIYIYIYILRE